MARTGIVIDQRYLEHDTGAGHPERAARIANLALRLAGSEVADRQSLEPRAATTDEIALVREAGHIERVAASAEHERFAFDADTPVCALLRHRPARGRRAAATTWRGWPRRSSGSSTRWAVTGSTKSSRSRGQAGPSLDIGCHTGLWDRA